MISRTRKIILSEKKETFASGFRLRGLALVLLGISLSACSGMPGSSGGSPIIQAVQPISSPVRSAPVSEVASYRNVDIRYRDLTLRKAAPMEAGWSSAGVKAKDDAAPDTDDLETASGNLDANDPIEPVNRLIFAVNDAMDVIVLKPVATTYKFWVPEVLRNSVRNVLRNLSTPVTLLNDLLQGDAKRAGKTLARFALNSTIGFGGLGDPATEMGLQYHYEDFGQTMAVHGVGEGPYLVLPILGPSTLRHTVGRGVDFATDPLTYVLWKKPIYYSGGRKGAEVVSNRTELLQTIDDLKETSVDYYTTIRSTYRQNRLSEINNGEIDVDELPDISDLD